VRLLELNAKKLRDDGAQPDTVHSEQSCSEFGVKNVSRRDSHFAKTRQILTRRVKDPFLVTGYFGQFRHVSDCRRIKQKRACIAPIDLNQVGAL
jgi:hypothetical protein